MEKSTLTTNSCLQLNNSLIKVIYQHVSFLANHRYRLAISTLKSRHRAYETDDFIQDSMRLIIESFENHSFKTIYHLKSFINKVMNFHYLKEKKKYFYTKQRGTYSECSIDECINDESNADMHKIIEGQASIQLDNIILNSILQKNLYVIYNKGHITVCESADIKKYKNGYIISIALFIKMQILFGIKDTCKYYKNNGFYMTRNIFNNISQVIVNYLYDNNYLERVKEEKKYDYSRVFIENEIDRLTKLANTCTCGYVNKTLVLSDTTWQCPRCGKIHDRDALIRCNSMK